MIQVTAAFLQRYPLLRQLTYFGLIGGCAAAVQLLAVITLVETTGLKPLSANVFGFLLAFNISYFGHRRFTFAGTNIKHHIAMRRLFTVASANFIANETLFYIFLNVFKMYYPLALLLVLIILPTVTFILGRFWVFK
jgi:putative flippase GtrA